MEHVSFVILQYGAIDITIQCIESIKSNIEYENYSIVVVDNGSPDGSGYILAEKYKDDKTVVVLLIKENMGFAKGNNIGYRYAKNELQSKYIIITNSDTVFEQKEFVSKMIELYRRKKYEIAGPDLVTPSGVHQNPHRERPLTKSNVKKMLFIKSSFLLYFRIKKVLHLENKINILEKWFEIKDQKTQKNVQYQKEMENIVLLGACLIFSPSYIEKEKEAFFSGTFMYGEEDILTYICIKKGYKLLYLPELKLFHLNGEITRKKYENNLEKNIFTYKYIVEGCRILLRLMRNEEKYGVFNDVDAE